MNKKAQIDMEILLSRGFFILTGVGLAAFFIMLLVLKQMGSSDIMPWWVKVITIIAIPVASYIFTLIHSER